MVRSRISQDRAGAATLKSEDSIRLSSCKQQCSVAKWCCYPGYTAGEGSLGRQLTTDFDSWRASPRSSQIATTMPPSSCVKILMERRVSHQCSGSYSPSRALATRTLTEAGNIRWKIYRERLVW